ncbi:permease [Caulobacter soli]|uniref:permease n=1 Tax=Caulobacter soli TaxID=2708539 RepID=UPI0013ED56B8|nr:permease [Caulobacter soli]
MKLLRSFEEFLFEATSWLVFYPLTLWRVLVKPLETMAYSDSEQGDDETGRYDDALTPPLFLLITVVLMNGIAMAAHLPQAHGTGTLQHAIFNSPQNAALFRALIFSLIPLVAAVTLLRRQGIRLSRESLRAPFYAQCYLAGPCAVFLIGGGIIFMRHDIANVFGAGLMLAGLAWFLIAQTRWFASRLAIKTLPAVGIALWAWVQALVFFAAIMTPVVLL